MKNRKPSDHTGSTFDSFLEEEGLLEQSEAVAAKRVYAWQLQAAMGRRRMSKSTLAKRLRTSRSQVDRLLDPGHVGVSFGTMARAAYAVGKRVRFQMVDHGGNAVKASATRTGR
jgi:antitoxin HicB